MLQVIVVVLAFAADPIMSKLYVGRSDLRVAYVVTPLQLALKLNFPLVVLWLPVLYFIRLTTPDIGSPSGALTAAIDVAVVTSTAAFWYLVVVEVEMRKRKASCLRLSGRHMDRLKATVMILIGVGAAVYAFWDGYQLLVFDQVNRHYFFWSAVVADALIGGLFLFGWAAALITMGVQDIVRVSDSR